MEWLKKFMAGRYGGDQLSVFLIVISIVFTLLGSITGLSILVTLSYVPMFLAVYRVFSKDVQKRSMENYKFAIFMSPVYSKFKKVQKRYKGSKTHKYFDCPKCKGKLRVPKGRGKIMITCPKCKERFAKRT